MSPSWVHMVSVIAWGLQYVNVVNILFVTESLGKSHKSAIVCLGFCTKNKFEFLHDPILWPHFVLICFDFRKLDDTHIIL